MAENGQGIVALVQEKFGDGIMSAINFYITVDKLIGSEGEWQQLAEGCIHEAPVPAKP